MTNIYKYGFLSLCGVFCLVLLYFAYFGAIERAEAFATWMNNGMSVHDARMAVELTDNVSARKMK